MYEFEFVKPASLADAIAALGAEEAQALGGGQTLIPTLKQRLAAPAVLVSLTGIEEMKGISSAAGQVVIGGATPHAEVASGVAAAYPALAALAGNIGDPAVRNRGTIGGSLANNDPSACYPAAALASGASIVTNAREIAADDYFQGMFETALDEDEIITAVRFPIPQAAGYAKFDNPASRYALVGVFVAKTAAGPRVAVTGAGQGGVFRASDIESQIASGQEPNSASIDEDDLNGDIHASPAYRKHLIGVMAKRALASAG